MSALTIILFCVWWLVIAIVATFLISEMVVSHRDFKRELRFRRRMREIEMAEILRSLKR